MHEAGGILHEVASEAGAMTGPGVATTAGTGITGTGTGTTASGRRRRLPLHLQVFLRLAPAVAVVFVAAIAISAWRGYREDRAELHDKLTHVVGNQSIVMAESMARGHDRHVGQMAAGVMADPEIVYMLIEDTQGRPVLTLGQTPEHGFVERRPITLVEDGKIVELGTISVGATYRGVLSTLMHNLLTSLTGALFATLASWGALIIVLNRVVGAPVRRLRVEIDTWRRPGRRAAERETDESDDGDEIAALTRAFDALKQERRHHEQALQSLLDDLERRVEERTRAMRHARDAAERANAAKADFLAAMSHEIRTPMNAILAIAHTLSADGADPRDAVSLRVLRDSGRQLISLLDEILDLSKIEAGKLAIAREPTDLAALAHGVGEMWRAEAAARGLALSIECAPDFPTRVLADGVRLRQCLGNLVSNAVKFTGSGSITIRLELVDDAGGGTPTARLSVSDSGPGIAEDGLAALFEPFVQGRAPRGGRQGGTGLGLAITRRLMRLMGGEVEVETAPGAGACFTMRFPVEPVTARPRDTADGDAAGGDARADGALPDLSDARVLVVDDVATNRYVARLLLEPAGMRVIEAASGAEAIALLAEEPVDLVLLDLHMPEMDGIETIARIRAMPPPGSRARLVVLTADTRDALQDRLHALPIDAVMTKPIDAAEAIRTVGRLLGRSPARPPVATGAPAARPGPFGTGTP